MDNTKREGDDKLNRRQYANYCSALVLGMTFVLLASMWSFPLLLAISPVHARLATKYVWGIQPGDKITWKCHSEGFTGYVGGGMGSFEYDETITWEIVEITDSYASANDAVRIKDKYGGYFWKNLTTVAPGLYVDTKHNYGIKDIAIYPVYKWGDDQDLKSARRWGIEPEIDHLPQSDVTEYATYIKGYGKTSSGQGYTPVVTEWKEIIIHRGTGIITSVDHYYNDNEYSITKRSSVSVETNFDLSSRLPYDIPEDLGVEYGYSLWRWAQLLDSTSTSIAINWTAFNESPGRDELVQYEIYQSTSLPEWDPRWATPTEVYNHTLGTKIHTITDVSTNSYTITGLSPDTTYYFTIRTVYVHYGSDGTVYPESYYDMIVPGETEPGATEPGATPILSDGGATSPLIWIAAVSIVAFAAVIVTVLLLKRRKARLSPPQQVQQ